MNKMYFIFTFWRGYYFNYTINVTYHKRNLQRIQASWMVLQQANINGYNVIMVP